MLRIKKIIGYIPFAAVLLFLCFVFYNPVRQALGLINGTVSSLYFTELTVQDINSICVIYIDDNEVKIDEYFREDYNFSEIGEYLSNIEVKSLRNSYGRTGENLTISIFIRFDDTPGHTLKLSLYSRNVISIEDKMYKMKDDFNMDLLSLGNLK